MVVASAMLVAIAIPALGQVYYSHGQAITLTRAMDKVLVEVDGSQAAQDLAVSLAEAGFPTIRHLEGVPERFGFREVAVSSADSVTMALLRGIPGIRRARHLYRIAGQDAPLIPTDQVVVRFLPGTTAGGAAAMAAKYGATIDHEIYGLPQAYVLNVDDESVADAIAVAEALYAEPTTQWCHPSFLLKMQKHQSAQIDDPLYPFQWHLNNTGQLDGALVDADIDAPEAWTVTEGYGAVVGVIDDAVNWEHEDLIDNYITGYDFTDLDGDPNPGVGLLFGSSEEHGTAVSGLICARGNTIGLRGVAPLAGLIGCRALSAWPQDIALAEAFLFCERNGAMAINNSWGGPGGVILPVVPNDVLLLPDLISDAIDEVAINGRSGKGVLVLFSSGNSGILLSYDNSLAAWPSTMAIGATLRNDILTCYSSFGEEQSVVAPGGGVGLKRSQGGGLELGECFDSDMATTDVMDSLELPTTGYNPPIKYVGWEAVIDPDIEDFPNYNYTHHFNGTSAACPVVTGVAALVFSVNPDLTAEQARNLIEHTADKIQAPNERFDAVTGHNVRYGHGRVNAYRAVQAASAGHNWPSPIDDLIEVHSQSLIQLNWTNPENDVAAVLVARALAGQLEWAPTDGIEYTVGQQVAPGVSIVANSLIEQLDQTGLTAGEYEFALFARNGSHYYSWGRRIGFESTGTVAVPLASLSASPRVGGSPLSVHFAGGAIDPSGLKALQFSWDFGDGGTAVGAAVDHIFAATGQYTVELTVTNGAGQTAKAKTRIVVTAGENEPPQAHIAAYPTSGAAPLVVIFEGAGTDTDGSVVSYKWKFGDGTTAMGQVVEHTYIFPAIYGATLTVTDDRGSTGIDSVLIKVTAPGTTAAAETAPQDLLNTPPECGTGIPMAAVGVLIGMIGLMTVRRRR